VCYHASETEHTLLPHTCPQASGCNVKGATKYDVYSSADVQKIMAIGSANRHTSETKMNDRSSRSHQILTVLVEGQHLVTGGRSHGCLHLIDLAGSERVGKSEASGGWGALQGELLRGLLHGRVLWGVAVGVTSHLNIASCHRQLEQNVTTPHTAWVVQHLAITSCPGAAIPSSSKAV
jgi:hypothetical protein